MLNLQILDVILKDSDVILINYINLSRMKNHRNYFHYTNKIEMDSQMPQKRNKYFNRLLPCNTLNMRHLLNYQNELLIY